MKELSKEDQKWIDALRPYVYGGPVPYYRNEDQSINASKTVDQMMLLLGVKKPE